MYSWSYVGFDHWLSLESLIASVVRIWSSELGSGSPTQPQMTMSYLSWPLSGISVSRYSVVPSVPESTDRGVTPIPIWPNQSAMNWASFGYDASLSGNWRLSLIGLFSLS